MSKQEFLDAYGSFLLRQILDKSVFEKVDKELVKATLAIPPFDFPLDQDLSNYDDDGLIWSRLFLIVIVWLCSVNQNDDGDEMKRLSSRVHRHLFHHILNKTVSKHKQKDDEIQSLELKVWTILEHFHAMPLLAKLYEPLFASKQWNCKEEFQSMIRDGLCDPDPLIRRAAFHLLKRAIRLYLMGRIPIHGSEEELLSNISKVCSNSPSNDNFSVHSDVSPFLSVQQKRVAVVDNQSEDIQSSLSSLTISNPVFEGTSVCLITSLLDKVPNIAGMCRTAEIFAIDRFVVSDLSLIDTKDFQTVCMTSDKWVKMEQCQTDELVTFVKNLQRDMYTIIAIEQSSTSIPLHKFTFPEKFALILGNERWGVWPELLARADVCLEIPQFGRIRSLNVHVAGSLVLWEARRQRMLI